MGIFRGSVSWGIKGLRAQPTGKASSYENKGFKDLSNYHYSLEVFNPIINDLKAHHAEHFGMGAMPRARRVARWHRFGEGSMGLHHGVDLITPCRQLVSGTGPSGIHHVMDLGLL